MMMDKYLPKPSLILESLKANGWKHYGAEEGLLMLLELSVKANAGFYNSHTEEGFLSCFGYLTKNRTLNKKGRRFLCSMLYKSSLNKSEFVRLSEIHRK